MELLLYLADDVQRLESGKLILVGVYTDRVVVLNPIGEAPEGPTPEQPYAITKLAFVLTLCGVPAGRHRFAFSVIDPNGEQVPYEGFPTPESDVPDGGSPQYIINCAPFVVPVLGVYKFIVTVSGEPVESTFELRLGKAEPAKRAVRAAA